MADDRARSRWLDDDAEREERQASLSQLVADVDARRNSDSPTPGGGGHDLPETGPSEAVGPHRSTTRHADVETAQVDVTVREEPTAATATAPLNTVKRREPTGRISTDRIPTARTRAATARTPSARTASAQSVPEPTQVLPAVDGAARRTPASTSPGVGTASSRPRRRRGRWLFRIVITLLLIGVGYYAFTLFQVWSTGRADERQPVDAIVAMGAAQYDGRPSPQLAARLDRVVELWPEGIAPLVVVTGGNLPGDRFTEAGASAQYLIERGIPESALILEDEGASSYESLSSVGVMLESRGLDDVVIVTDPYHSLRSRLIAQEVGLDASVSSTDTSVISGTDSLVQHLREAGGVAVGRVIGFDRLTNIIG